MEGAGESIAKTQVGVSTVVQYLRLLAVFASSIVCAGITPGINVFAPLFAESGLYASACGDDHPPCPAQITEINVLVMSVFGFAQLGNIPGGVAFDMLGGRASGIIGGMCTAAGSIFLVLGLMYSSGTLVGLAAIMMDAGNIMSSNAFLGMMWHLPEAQNFIFSLITACTSAAAALPVILEAAMATFDISLETALVGFALVDCAAACIMHIAVPTQAEYFAKAEVALGVPISAPTHTWKNFRYSFVMASRVLAMKPTDVWLLSVAGGLGSMAVYQYTSQVQSFGSALFGDKEIGRELAIEQSNATGTFSVVVLPLIGYLADFLPLHSLTMCLYMSLLVVLVFTSTESFGLQLVIGSWSQIAMPLVGIITWRWMACWTPPHRYGLCMSIQALISTVIAVISAPILLGITAAQGLSASSYIMGSRIVGLVTILVLAWFAYRVRLNPTPSFVIIDRDEEEIMSQNFGLKTFEDAEEVLLMKRERILRLLASQELAERRKLIDIMKSPEAQTRWVKVAYAKGYDLPEGIDSMQYLMIMAMSWESKLQSMFCCTVTGAALH